MAVPPAHHVAAILAGPVVAVLAGPVAMILAGPVDSVNQTWPQYEE